MTTLAAAGPSVGAPARRAGSVRRTTHVDVGPADEQDWRAEATVPLGMTGRARDLHTSQRASTVGSASVDARVAPDRTLAALETTPPTDPGALLGEPVGEGFRATALPDLADPSSPLGQLLRDLPTALLISGYAKIRSATLAGTPPGQLVPPEVLPSMSDLCSGWRSDGTMTRSLARGDGVPLQDCPPAPVLTGTDPDGWHHLPALPAGWMRRLRRIDVVRMGEELVVDAMLRDTHADRAAGDEVILHEYTLAAWFDADGLATRELSAVARVVPFPECPWATDGLDALVGVPAPELRRAARRRLAGTAGCTHLNDLIACLSDLPALRPDEA